MIERARRSLIIWNIGVGLGLVTIIVLTMYFSISNSIEKEIANDLTNTATIILQNPETSKPVGTPIAEISPQNKSGNDDKISKNDEDEDEDDTLKERTARLALADTFYFRLDSIGNVLFNSRNINYPGLPDRTKLNRVMAGENLFWDVKLANGISLRLYAVPVRQADGKIIGQVQIGKDLTTHQEQLRNVLVTTGLVSIAGLILALIAAFILTQHSLIPVRQSLERQREFVADASHELRTPLALIRANAEVALRHSQQTIAQNAELLEDICKESDYLTELVANLLTLARADMGKLELTLEPVELGHLVTEVVREVRPLAEAKQLRLEISQAEELWLSGDSLRLRQLLVILLDNAIKYTDAGSVSLKLERGRNQAVVLTVSDSGVGIPADKLERIFERFYRVDKTRSRSEGGCGIGLAIASLITQLHQGTISVKSQPGQGATFTITLPTQVPPKLLQK